MHAPVYDTINLADDMKTLLPILMARLDELEASGGFIQAQPIGMMRIALDQQRNNQEGLFLHVWSSEFPIQKTGGPFAHTHVFDLESKVIRGEIQDTTYTPVSDPEGSFKLVKGLCLQDHCSLEETIIDRVEMVPREKRTIRAGTNYTIPKGEFHLTHIGGDGLAVTLMKKTNVDQDSPTLAIPNDLRISREPFDRNQLNQALAWRKLRHILSKI